MKKGLLLIIVLNFNLLILNASSGLLKDGSVFKCGEEYYGTHGKDVHYHKAEKTNNGKYKAIGDSLGSNWVCNDTITDIDESIILENEEVTFEKCVDGDTAVFNVSEKEEKFRFLGIDTPETKHPTKSVQDYGIEASEYTCTTLTNASIIEVEYEENRTDKYNRYLAWIWVDGKLLQEDLISKGLAEVSYIYGNYKYTNHLCNVQAKAIENNLGIWNTGRKEGFCSSIRKLDIKSNEKDQDINIVYLLPLLIIIIIFKKLGGRNDNKWKRSKY